MARIRDVLRLCKVVSEKVVRDFSGEVCGVERGMLFTEFFFSEDCFPFIDGGTK